MVNQDTSTNRCIIFANGNLGNHDNSYGAISDERIKQDITDVNSQWDDIKNLKVRNFKMKDDIRAYGGEAEKRIGLIGTDFSIVLSFFSKCQCHFFSQCSVLSIGHKWDIAGII